MGAQTRGTHDTYNNGKVRGGRPGSKKEKKQALWRIEEVPEHMRFNKFILHGYRPTTLGVVGCLKSLWYHHNETTNVITHLTPALAALAGLILVPWSQLPPYYVALQFTWWGTLLSMGASALYHLFMPACVTKAAYDRLLFVDVIGVWALMTLAFVVLLVLGYPCWPIWTTLGFATVSSLAGLVVLWVAKDVKGRGKGFLLVSIARALGTIIRLVVPGPSMQANAVYIFAEAVVLTGGVINVARWPERSRAPGAHDFAFNSHQIMHVLVVIGLAALTYAVLMDLDVINQSPMLVACASRHWDATL